VVAGRNNANTQVMGAEPEYAEIRKVSIDQGNFITQSDVDGLAKVAVLGPQLAANLFPDGQEPVGQLVRISGQVFRVIGLTTAKGGTGISGGVDSSVAAALLLKKGYEVIGVFMKNWSENVGDFCCSWSEDLEDARRVAQTLGIRFYVWNFEKEYKKQVISYFFNEYKAGRTPNPDVMCNREIKFKLFLEKALRFGADFVATGHYARVKKVSSDFRLLKGKDGNKDQTYFLYTLTQKELQYVLFPIGEYKKPAVRVLAKKFNLPTFAKKDSQGICFIGEVDIKALLQQQIKPKTGQIINTKGEVLGKHEGFPFYTLGQRGGLDVGGKGPYYVVAKNKQKNQIIVSDNPDDPLLWRKECLLVEVSWTRKIILPEKIEVTIRYRHATETASLKILPKGKARLIFNNPQRAITPGQAAVFYIKDELIGGGVIDEVI
jgi:tRNA-specific 2-thiouridylase